MAAAVTSRLWETKQGFATLLAYGCVFSIWGISIPVIFFITTASDRLSAYVTLTTLVITMLGGVGGFFLHLQTTLDRIPHPPPSAAP